MKNNLLFTTTLFILINNSFLTVGQALNDEFTPLIHGDSLNANTIAMYPPEVRKNIFKVSSHPEGIARLNDVQKKSNEAFRKMISAYSKDDQNRIWNLMRYNDLISQLVKTKGKSKRVDEVLRKYPVEVKENAVEYVTHHYELLVSINNENLKFNESFQSILAGYSPNDQTAFKEMLNTPEALSLLNENMRFTVLLGDLYKKDSIFLFHRFDSLNLVLAEQKAKEAEEWKEEMTQNPDAQQELKQSAEEYAKENENNGSNFSNTDPKIIEHYIYLPYPYWCGYPWWYEYSYWYPYPYWYHYGFYYWNGDMIWIGPPSWYFVHWHFHYHTHFYHYPHLTNVYINHYYYGPRKTLNRNTNEVREWMKRNEKSLPGDFKTNKDQRIGRIRDFGKMETDREKYNQVNPGKNSTRDEFIKQHPNDYPHLQQPVIIEQPAPANPDVRPVEIKPGQIPVKDKIKAGPGKTQPKQGEPKKQQINPKQVQPKQITPRTQPRNEKVIPGKK